MKRTKQTDYLAPKIKAGKIQIEQGFALSNPNSESMPEIDGENEDIGW